MGQLRSALGASVLGTAPVTAPMAALLTALLTALLLGSLLAPPPALGFSGFGEMTADGTFDDSMTFSVELPGGAPEQLEILLTFGEDEATFVAPVSARGDDATYTWDTAASFVVPNTTITYRWRATVDGEAVESASGELLYDDDRAGLDWQRREMGEAAVHWYGDAEDAALRFGELSAEGTAQAEALLGVELAAPIDIFVYEDREEFFGALGPGAREWTGAAAYPALRTVFMQLGQESQEYLETALVHEVTHVVFHDATANPFHEPAQWLNEGLATWAEERSADSSRAFVEFEAASGGLLAFEGITQAFPIDDRAAGLAYSQGAVMVDRIIADHGEGALAAIAAAYRDGATDAEALEAATGVPADDLYDAFYADFGAEEPQPIEPVPLDDSDVPLPDGGLPEPEPQPAATDPAGVPDGGQRPNPAPAEAASDGPSSTAWLAIAVGVAALALVVAAVTVGAVRRGRRAEPPPPAGP